MEARTLAAALLKCGYLDIDYLVDLIDANNLDFESILEVFDWFYEHSRPTVNDLITLAFDVIAQNFLATVVK